MRRTRRWIVVAPLVVLALLSACGEVPETESELKEPMTLEPIEGTEFSRVILTARAVERLGIETITVTGGGQRTTVPASAVWVGVNGEEWLYTAPEPLVFVREVVSVDRYEGDVAVLSDGPETGTQIVTVGVPELIGSEFGI
ncbi:MAG: hypothetical protein ACRDG8_02205 [Actinomycetota bacterium]